MYVCVCRAMLCCAEGAGGVPAGRRRSSRRLQCRPVPRGRGWHCLVGASKLRLCTQPPSPTGVLATDLVRKSHPVPEGSDGVRGCAGQASAAQPAAGGTRHTWPVFYQSRRSRSGSGLIRQPPGPLSRWPTAAVLIPLRREVGGCEGGSGRGRRTAASAFEVMMAASKASARGVNLCFLDCWISG